MGKGRRSQGPHHASPSRDNASEQATEQELSNAAQVEELDGRYVPMDAAGDGAKPVVEHARLALELRYEGQTPVARLVALAEASALPEDTRSWLAERLRANEAAERRVSEALERWFGASDEAVRERLGLVLRSLAEDLERGEPTESGWMTASGETEVPAAGTVREAVDRLLAGLGGADGDAVVGLCRQLQLTILLDEEEDEVDLFGLDPSL